MSGHKIKSMLQEMRLVLMNVTNHFDADYHVSQRGAPYVRVIVNGERYQFVYFNSTRKFRVFFPNHVDHVDCVYRDDVIKFFRSIAGLE